MNKTFVYRKHLRVMGKLTGIILYSLAIILFLIGLLFMVFIRESEGTFIAVFMFFMALIIAVEAFILKKFYSRFTKVKVTLTDEGIIYENYKETIKVNYEDIKAVQFPSIRYLGGWVKIISNQKPIRLTVVIEHIHEFIYDFKNQLEDRVLNQLIDEKKWLNFFKLGLTSDLSWERLYPLVKWIIATFVFILGGTISFTVVMDLTDYFRSTIIGSTAIFLITYLFIEIKLYREVYQQVKEQPYTFISNNKVREKKLYVNGLIVTLILWISYLILLLVIL